MACRFGRRRHHLAPLALIALSPLSAAAADRETMIQEALDAAPAAVAEHATVRSLEGETLREGEGSYTCFPAPQGVAGPMCMDAEWLRWMDAWMKQEPFQARAVGVAYMVAGDSAQGGASNADPCAVEPTLDNDWVVEGPHVMIITPDPAAMTGLPTSKDVAGPYVMWSGTPYAHIMLPVGPRPEQRPVGAE